MLPQWEKLIERHKKLTSADTHDVEYLRFCYSVDNFYNLKIQRQLKQLYSRIVYVNIRRVKI